MKQCRQCRLSLPLDRFGPDGRTGDGLSPKCASCRSIALPGDVEKRCLMCATIKSIGDYHKDLQSPDLHRKICKTCGSRSAKSWNKNNKEAFNRNVSLWRKAHKDATRSTARRSHLKKTYDITEVQYWELFDSQDRGCAICGVKPKTRHLHVDHNHKTDEVRGLLCASCNGRLLPIIEHHPDRIEKALQYLSDPPARKVLVGS